MQKEKDKEKLQKNEYIEADSDLGIFKKKKK